MTHEKRLYDELDQNEKMFQKKIFFQNWFQWNVIKNIFNTFVYDCAYVYAIDDHREPWNMAIKNIMNQYKIYGE